MYDFSDRYFSDEFSILVKMEVQIIRKDEIAQWCFVSVKLFFVARLLRTIQIGIADVFGFNKSDRDVLSGEDKIRGTTGLAFRFVSGRYVRDNRFEELLKITSEGVFSGVPQVVPFCYLVKVMGDGHISVGYSGVNLIFLYRP